MRYLVLSVVFSACTPWVEFPEVQGPGDVQLVTPGRYSGEATLEVRAFAGPVQVAREVCITPVIVSVDPDAESLIQGELSCTFEDFGEVNADIVGDEDGAIPLLAGELVASQLSAEWDGWFIDERYFYAELVGEQPHEGMELRFRGFMEADRFAPLGGSVGP